MNLLLSHHAPIRNKLNPPQYLQAAMDRPRLLNASQQIQKYKICKIVAPPGYGKSTYLSQLRQSLLQTRPKPWITWLNLDAEDNDPITMTEYLCAAFHQYNSKIAERSLQILKSGSLRSLKELYIALIEDVQQSQQPWILFVDDFHVLEKGESLKLWQWFLDHLPKNLTLIIASRKNLPLQLKRLQLNQELLSIEAEKLQFNHEETRRFFLDYRHQKLSEDLLKLVQQKTEGWIGAMQMLSLSLHPSFENQNLVEHFSGEHQDMMEYLSEVVLEQLPSALRNFILKISILDRFSASVATRLSGEPLTQEMIEEIERRHLFLIPLDSEKRWYRFHHLFQDFLRRQTFKFLGEKVVYEKYREASLWFEQENYHHEAIHYALTGKDYPRAAELLSGFAMQLSQNRGDHRTMLHWMRQLPEMYLAPFPMIRMSYAFSLTCTHNYDQAKQELKKLKNSINPQMNSEIRFILLASIEMNECILNSFKDQIITGRKYSEAWLLRWPNAPALAKGLILCARGVSHYYSSKFEEGNNDFSEAIKILKYNKHYYAYAWPLGCQVAIHWTHGKLTHALELSRVALIEIHKYLGTNFSLEKLLEIAISEIFYERADFAKALSFLEDRKIYIYSFSNTECNIIYYCMSTRLCLLKQEFSKVASYLIEAERWAKELDFPRFQDQMFLLKIELYLQTRRIPEARQLLESRGWSHPQALVDEIEDTNAMMRNIFERLALARVLMAEKKFAEASRQLQSLIMLLEKIGLMRHLLSARIIEVLCEENLKSHDNALQKLQQTLELAAPEVFVSVFLEHGAELNHQLYILLKQVDGLSVEAIKLRNKILRQLELYFEQSQKDKTQGMQLLDKISGRELEILSALNSTKSNAQLAKSLHISLGTLKWHLHNIYQKLDVKNRSGAVLKAKQLELT